MDIIYAKTIALVVLFTLALFFGFLPFKIIPRKRREFTDHEKKRSRVSRDLRKRIISWLSCFSGGVFLASCFLDLLPEVRRRMNLVLSELDFKTTFPISELIMALGCFLILSIEQIVLTAKEKDPMAKIFHQHEHDHKDDGHHGHHGNSSPDATKPLLGGNDEDYNDNLENRLTSSVRSDRSLTGISGEPDIRGGPDFASYSIGQPQHKHDDTNSHSSLRSMILLMALSLHSLFEGLAVGLQESTPAVFEILIALVIHKSIMAFSLGLNMVQSKLTRTSIIQCCVVFAITAPVGIGIGMGISNVGSHLSANISSGVLQGIATGTFLYITFFEVLPHEMNSSRDRLIKLFTLILGFGVLTGLMFLDPAEPEIRCIPPAPSIDNVTLSTK